MPFSIKFEGNSTAQDDYKGEQFKALKPIIKQGAVYQLSVMHGVLLPWAVSIRGQEELFAKEFITDNSISIY